MGVPLKAICLVFFSLPSSTTSTSPGLEIFMSSMTVPGDSFNLSGVGGGQDLSQCRDHHGIASTVHHFLHPPLFTSRAMPRAQRSSLAS